MKSLKPTMRENKRYLLVHGKNLRENIEKAILEFIGILGMSKTGLSFVKVITQVKIRSERIGASEHRETLKDKNEEAIICINREMVDSVRASFAVFPEKIEVGRVSGTLRGLRGK